MIYKVINELDHTTSYVDLNSMEEMDQFYDRLFIEFGRGQMYFNKDTILYKEY